MKMLGLTAVAFLVGFSFNANAGEPVQLSDTTLDSVVAGNFVGGYGFGFGTSSSRGTTAIASADTSGRVTVRRVYRNGQFTTSTDVAAYSSLGALGFGAGRTSARSSGGVSVSVF